MNASRPLNLGIVVVNFWSASQVAQLADSIAAADSFGTMNVSMAIVDNSDQQGELLPIAELARARSMNCQILHGHGNIGYAAGNNLGAAWLLERGAEVIWLLNPDTSLVGGSLAAMAEIRARGERVVAATCDAETSGPGVGAVNLWTGQSGKATALEPPGGARVTYVSGHSLALTRQAWIELNGLSEDYFLFYEEADLAFRSSCQGIPTMVLSGLVVKHIGGTTTGVTKDLRAKSKVAYFHGSRSCLIFFRKHYRKRVPLIATMRVAYAAKVLFAGGARSAGAVLRGTVAGLRA